MIFALTLLLTAGAVDDGWEESSRKLGVVVYTRKLAHMELYETMAVGMIDAPPSVVKYAIDDVDKSDDMPYLKEARVIRRDDRGALIYHRTAPPVVSDRDYTILMFDASARRDDGTLIYITRWHTANEEGPPPRPKVVRVPRLEGYWRLEPVDGGKRTRATYFVFSDPGGALPRALAAMGSGSALPEVFEAMRRRVKDPKYHRCGDAPARRLAACRVNE
jgi:hypothetical protein